MLLNDAQAKAVAGLVNEVMDGDLQSLPPLFDLLRELGDARLIRLTAAVGKLIERADAVCIRYGHITLAGSPQWSSRVDRTSYIFARFCKRLHEVFWPELEGAGRMAETMAYVSSVLGLAAGSVAKPLVVEGPVRGAVDPRTVTINPKHIEGLEDYDHEYD